MQKFFISVSRLISETMVFFYAVARGRNPGIYATWEQCRAEVHKFPQPIYKKFSSKAEAENFVTSRGGSSLTVKSTHGICLPNTVSNKSEKPGLSTTTKIKSPYDEMEKTLKNWAKDRKCLSQHDVQSQASKIANELGIENFNPHGGWLKYHLECNPGIYKLLRVQNSSEKVEDATKVEGANILQQLSNLESRISGLSTIGVSIPSRVKILERTLRSMHQELHEIKRHLSTDAHEGSSAILSNRKRKKVDESEEEEASENLSKSKQSAGAWGTFDVDGQDFVNVFTDGACSGNGRLGAAAGIGVWFGDNHPLNISRPVAEGCRATNNLAEIQAVTEAARQATKAGVKKLKINTDSQFLISCITQWMPKWKRNGWKKADGEPVINKPELIEMESALQPLIIAWNHVRGHAGVYGNEMADKLARAGAAAQSKK